MLRKNLKDNPSVTQSATAPFTQESLFTARIEILPQSAIGGISSMQSVGYHHLHSECISSFAKQMDINNALRCIHGYRRRTQNIVLLIWVRTRGLCPHPTGLLALHLARKWFPWPAFWIYFTMLAKRTTVLRLCFNNPRGNDSLDMHGLGGCICLTSWAKNAILTLTEGFR